MPANVVDTHPARRRDYVTAHEAMQILGVRAQTLYAYVSRGWIHSIAQKGVRDRLYLGDDIQRVSMRSVARSGHGAVAASAMNWGAPIFPTSVTEITPQGPRYRGHLAADLVKSGVSFEAVAEILWTQNLSAGPCVWPVRKSSAGLRQFMQATGTPDVRGNLLEWFALVVLVLGVQRGSVAERLSQGDTLQVAREIMQTVVACCGFVGPAHQYQPMRPGDSMVQGLMQALALAPSHDNSEALRTILILMADHELPPGTLSARVVASSGGTLHSCIAAACCATSGVDVGRMYERVESFLGHPSSKTVLMNRARLLHAQGQTVPGFGHPLYPQGDPRATHMLDIARKRTTHNRELRAVFRFIDELAQSHGLLPRQELALVVLTRAMNLPSQAPVILFALGRIAGWVAHVQEQRTAGTLLRPRARFVKAPGPH